MPYSENTIISIGDTSKVKLNINILSFHTFGSLLILQTNQVDLTGITA